MEKELEAQKQSAEHLDFYTNRKPNCLVEFDVIAKPQLIKLARKEALKLISKEVSIPGFRKGKAPETLIEKHYPKAIDEESKKALANLSFRECQKIAKIALLNDKTQINFNVTEINENEAKLKIYFEAEPLVPEINFSHLNFTPVEKPQITEEKLNRGIRQILHVYAKWNKVEDRPVKEGDFVLLDLENLDVDPAQKVYNSQRFEVDSESMAKWMFDLVIGLNSGESKEGISEPDSDASDLEKESFKPTKVRLTVKSIEEAELPELNDEFAKQVGASDVDHFKTHVRNILEKQATDFVVKKERDQICDGLLENYDFDLPASLLQKETQFRLRQYLYEPSFLNDWKQMSDEERRKIVGSVSEDAKKALRLFYICRQIIHTHDIAIPREEVQAEMNNPLDPILNENQGSKTESETAEAYALALSRVMLAKAQDFILSKVKAE